MSTKRMVESERPESDSSSTIRSIILTLVAAVLAFLAQRYWTNVSGYQASIVLELGPKLSPNATIILPNDSRFAAATQRWVEYQAPSFGAVVIATDEKDVQQTVMYANAHYIPFLATSGKHGDISSLQRLKNGIQIDLSQLNKVEIPPKGQHATIGGGANTKHVISTLAAAGKRAVTGICDCVGMGGAMLGGGHGFLQGEYGLMADQLIDARLVLANGTVVKASRDSNADLYWALTGAGHNFGIITELKYRIYDLRGHESWSYEILTFRGDQIEAAFAVINDIAVTQPAEAVHLGFLARKPEIDPVNSVLIWTIVYDGSASALKAHATPLHRLQRLSLQTGQAPYSEAPKLYGSDANAPACQPGFTFMRFGILLQRYDIQAMLRIYDLFNQKTKDNPAFNNSMFALESYSTPAVRAVPADSTAFPYREDDILISPMVFYAPDSSLDAEARGWGEQMRNLALEGTGSTEMHVYINYAHGSESLEEIYGHEPWRLEKLRRLKAEYDPKGRFSFYAPIS